MSDANWQERKDGQEEQEFERALARSLRRVDAPQDFLAAVMAKVETERTNGAGEMQRGFALKTPWWRKPLALSGGLGWKPAWGGLAALLVAGVLTGHVVREHRAEEQEKARVQASREFDVSVQITDKALGHAREQLRKAGVALDGEQ